MNLDGKHNLKRFYILSNLGILLSLGLTISVLFWGHYRQATREHYEELRDEIFRSKREFIKDAVDRTIQQIEQERALCASGRYGRCDEATVKERLREHIRSIRLKDDGYIWVNAVVKYAGGDDYAYRFVHPNMPKTEGMMLSTNMRDIKGNFPYRTELEGVKEKGEIFFDYWFKKMNSDAIRHKLTYARLYKPYGWIVATGVYLDDVDGLVQSGMVRWESRIQRNVLMVLALTGIASLLAWFFSLLVGRRVDSIYSFFFKEVDTRENELRQREQEFRTLAENSPDCINRYDTECRFVYVNPQWEITTGIPAAAVLGKTTFEIVGNEESARHTEMIKQVIETGVNAETDLVLTDTGNGIRYHNIRYVAERGTDGEVNGVLAIGRDITAIKTAEWDLLLLNHALNHVHEAAYLISEDGRFVYVNEEACRFLGYSREELLSGMGVADIDANITPDFWQDHWRDFKAKGGHSIERSHTTRQGAVFSVEINATFFEYNGIGFSMALARDITGRKRAEQLTKARLKMLEIAQTASMDLDDTLRGMLDEIEALTGSCIGFYHFLEEDQQTLFLQTGSSKTLAAMRIAGWIESHYPVAEAGVWADCVRERRAIIHNDYATLPHRRGMPVGHAPVVRELVVPIFRDNRIVAIIGVGNKPEEYNDTDVQIVSLLGDFSWEIVARKQTEERLRMRECEFRTLAENSPDHIIRYDTGCRAIYINSRMERTLGRPVAPSLGRTPVEVAGEQYRAYQESIERVIATGEDAEFDLIMPDTGAGERHHNIRFVAERDTDGGITGVLAIGRDITERKRMEDELHKKNAELERFTYTVSHDLKSPLVTIKSFSGSIKQDLASGRHDRLEKDLGRIGAAADKMGALLDDLLKLSRVGRVISSPLPVDMAKLVDDVLNNLAGTLNETGVQVTVQPGLPTVPCDRQRMMEVVQNLVENGVKYRGDQPDPRIEIGLRAENNRQVFYVRDNGPGIEPQYHENIFGLFNRLDPRLPGSGVGLALVRRIIEVHGGRIWIESDGRGNGSTFCFTVR